MGIFKILFDGKELDETFDTYEDAEYGVMEALNNYCIGGETLELSNPGDYPYDPDYEPECEIIEV